MTEEQFKIVINYLKESGLDLYELNKVYQNKRRLLIEKEPTFDDEYTFDVWRENMTLNQILLYLNT